MVPGSTALAESVRIDLFIELLNRLCEARMRATGSSMLPTIWPGDVLTVQQCAIADARVGDVVLYTREDRLFAHRVTSEGAVSLVTQGDAIAHQDPPVTAHEFLGRVMSVCRAGKNVPVPANTSVSGRLISALVRRSPTASSIIQRGYKLRRRSVAA